MDLQAVRELWLYLATRCCPIYTIISFTWLNNVSMVTCICLGEFWYCELHNFLICKLWAGLKFCSEKNECSDQTEHYCQQKLNLWQVKPFECECVILDIITYFVLCHFKFIIWKIALSNWFYFIFIFPMIVFFLIILD